MNTSSVSRPPFVSPADGFNRATAFSLLLYRASRGFPAVSGDISGLHSGEQPRGSL